MDIYSQSGSLICYQAVLQYQKNLGSLREGTDIRDKMYKDKMIAIWTWHPTHIKFLLKSTIGILMHSLYVVGEVLDWHTPSLLACAWCKQNRVINQHDIYTYPYIRRSERKLTHFLQFNDLLAVSRINSESSIFCRWSGQCCRVHIGYCRLVFVKDSFCLSTITGKTWLYIILISDK